MDDRTAECRSRLAGFGLQLVGRRFAVEQTGDSAQKVSDPGAAEGTVAVTCHEREDDGDRLWFFGDGEPLSEADQPVTAVVALRAVLAGGGSR